MIEISKQNIVLTCLFVVHVYLQSHHWVPWHDWKCIKKVGKVFIRAKWPIRPELIPVSVAWSDWEYFYWEYFYFPPGWVASPSHGYPQHIKFAGTHLYTWVERGTVRVKRLAQEHNTMSPARAWTRSARSGVERAKGHRASPGSACAC